MENNYDPSDPKYRDISDEELAAAPQIEDFRKMMVRRANENKSILIGNLLDKAKNGDMKALDQIMEVVLDSAKEQDELILDITDERFNDIILIRAQRILGLLPAQVSAPSGARAPLAF